jgi:hypothetical protein
VVGGASPHPMKTILRSFLIKAIRETVFGTFIKKKISGIKMPHQSGI